MTTRTYTEDHLVEQPAIQFMQHELGWDVVNCSSSRSAGLRRLGWNGGLSNQGRDAKLEVPENNDFLISLKATVSPSAETRYFCETKGHFHVLAVFTIA